MLFLPFVLEGVRLQNFMKGVKLVFKEVPIDIVPSPVICCQRCLHNVLSLIYMFISFKATKYFQKIPTKVLTNYGVCRIMATTKERKWRVVALLKKFATVVEQADTRDLKFLGGNIVRVQVSPVAPQTKGNRTVRDYSGAVFDSPRAKVRLRTSEVHAIISFGYISGCGAVGSAGGLGPSGRRFEPCHSDHSTNVLISSFFESLRLLVHKLVGHNYPIYV